MIVVDSSVWIDYFNGETTRETNLLDSLLGREPIVIGDLILTEVLQGFRDDKDFNRAKALLDSLLFRPMLGRDMAIKSARNYRILRNKGVTVRKTIDVMIATFCIETNLPLLHNDRDFDPMETHLKLATVA
ncbi:MAG: twitching motility protein PilT [Planctomycetes bacterium RBG_13_60_9]|nr:MAG: twitching motility protein PilT [Planctomycetes bacterium RBG_13_60_9]